MGQTSKLRVILICLFTGIIFAMFFSWSAMNAARGDGSTFGRLALTISNFPTLVRMAAIETHGMIVGTEDYEHVSRPRHREDLAEFQTLQSLVEESLPRFLMSGSTRGADVGWRLFAGAFAFDDGVENAAVLVGPDFTIRRVWRLNEDIAGVDVVSNNRKIVHGLEISQDGDLIFLFDNGSTIQRIDACGRVLWSNTGMYHHSVNFGQDQTTLWTLYDPGLEAAGSHPTREAFVEIDARSGEIVRAIKVGDIIAANPELGLLLGGARDNRNSRNNSRQHDITWEWDPFHFNDIDPLPAHLVSVFPGFSAGDLLISSRTLNSLFVLDPKNLEIKWHLTGETHRQHDPDWRPDGRISIFDNRMGVGHSRLIAVDPETNQKELLISGDLYDFYTRVRGRHMLTPSGNLAIASPSQGRAFEVSGEDIVVEFYNLGPQGSGVNLTLTEYFFIPEAEINLEENSCATN